MSSPDLALPAAPSQFRTLTAVAAALTALSILWGFTDARLIDGVPVWMKPLKFALSFTVLFATLDLVERRLSPRVRDGRAMAAVGAVMATAFLSEMAYMIYQAARAEGSHFNLATPFHAFMYGTVMAVGAVALVASVGVVGWIARRDSAADLGPALREGIWLGFALTFGLTLIVAGYMSSGTGHFVGLHPQDAPVLPLFGWSGVTGDLRPAHFAALHAMQVLPLLGLWLDRSGRASAVRTSAVRTLRIAAAAYAVLTLAIFAQALMGLPLIPLG